jgi:looped-hinge helix DNA binding domain, AbrB family
MPSAMVTFNGRITLPTDIRKQLGLKTGDKVEFVEIGEGQFALRPRPEADGSASEEIEFPVLANESIQ